MHVAPWLPVGTREIYISSSSATPPCSVAFMFDIRSSRLQRPSVKLLTLDPCAAQDEVGVADALRTVLRNPAHRSEPEPSEDPFGTEHLHVRTGEEKKISARRTTRQKTRAAYTSSTVLPSSCKNSFRSWRCLKSARDKEVCSHGPVQGGFHGLYLERA